jgi:nucleotide-binding universal stress UspA family protein
MRISQTSTESCALVLYEASAGGRAALRHAAELVRAQNVPLVVLAVAPQARVDTGCLRCRGSAGLWNLAMVEVAEEELQEARELLAATGPQDVRFVVGRGDPVRAITAAVADVGADCVIVPPERTHRVPLARRRSLASRLGPDRPFTVVTPPANTLATSSAASPAAS